MTETINATEEENLHQNGDRRQVNNSLNINFDTLKELCQNNANYFLNDNSENGQKLYCCFLLMKESVDKLLPIITELQVIVPKYDFDEKTPGNGCRSFLITINYAILHGIQVNKRVCLKRDSVLFRKSTITKY